MSSDWTGIATSNHILGLSQLHGKINSERRVLLCEGEERPGRIGEDKDLLGKVATNWEIFCCGKKKRVLGILSVLRKHGPWRGLYAVVDKDEQKKDFDEDVLVWPGARDLECFLLRTEAWPRVLRTVLNPKVGMNLQPSPPAVEEGSTSLPRQFEIDESASANAWKAHNDGKLQTNYPHTKEDDETGRLWHPEYFEYLSPNSLSKPSKIPSEMKEVIQILLVGEMPPNPKLLTAEERALSMQGKRVMNLLAARIFSETYLRRGELGIEDHQLRSLRQKLSISGYCSKLRSLILDRVSADEMRRHFPQFE